MTTAMCYKPATSLHLGALPGERAISLPMLAVEQANPNPHQITGPRSMASVKMLRISVTDVCNLRCVYCMPAEGVEWLPKSHVLSYEEIAATVRGAVGLGVTHFKLTGGEPTARRDLPLLVDMLRRIEGVKDLSLTTNGILLEPMLEKLRDAGLNRITISLDSLHAERFATITRGGDLSRVWGAVHKALALGFDRLKINVVVMRGMNEDEVAAFAGLTRELPITVRFIEFMPLGRSGLTDAPEQSMVTEAEMRSAIEGVHGQLAGVRRETEAGVGPAKVFTLAPIDGKEAAGRIGFISAMSNPFCDSCNRLRLTPDGLLRSCLFDGGEIDLKSILRADDPKATPTSHFDAAGNLLSLNERLAHAFHTCVVMKPETHSTHGNKAMNRIGG